MPSTLKKCDALGCYVHALCCFGRCAAHCDTYCTGHQIQHYSHAPMPRREPDGCHGFLGIEFEVVPKRGTTGRDMARVARHVCNDCSVRGTHGSGVEVKVLSWCDRAPATVTGWLQRIHAAPGGAPITVNRTCGLHVHLDRRGVDRYRAADFCLAMNAALETWRRIVPDSRRHNQYITWDDDPDDRYSWVNLRAETVELRFHPGTLSPYKAGAWMAVCSDLLHVLRGPDSLPESLPTTAPIFGRVAREYLDARTAGGGAL